MLFKVKSNRVVIPPIEKTPSGNIPHMDKLAVQEQPDENDTGSQNGASAAVVEKKVDDDEDRKNPAYIPRKGYFFEHDMRGGDEASDEASKKEAEKYVSIQAFKKSLTPVCLS